jgi:hypothetical protein
MGTKKTIQTSDEIGEESLDRKKEENFSLFIVIFINKFY